MRSEKGKEPEKQQIKRKTKSGNREPNELKITHEKALVRITGHVNDINRLDRELFKDIIGDKVLGRFVFSSSAGRANPSISKPSLRQRRSTEETSTHHHNFAETAIQIKLKQDKEQRHQSKLPPTQSTDSPGLKMSKSFFIINEEIESGKLNRCFKQMANKQFQIVNIFERRGSGKYHFITSYTKCISNLLEVTLLNEELLINSLIKALSLEIDEKERDLAWVLRKFSESLSHKFCKNDEVTIIVRNAHKQSLLKTFFLFLVADRGRLPLKMKFILLSERPVNKSKLSINTHYMGIEDYRHFYPYNEGSKDRIAFKFMRMINLLGIKLHKINVVEHVKLICKVYDYSPKYLAEAYEIILEEGCKWRSFSVDKLKYVYQNRSESLWKADYQYYKKRFSESNTLDVRLFSFCAKINFKHIRTELLKQFILKSDLWQSKGTKVDYSQGTRSFELDTAIREICHRSRMLLGGVGERDQYTLSWIAHEIFKEQNIEDLNGQTTESEHCKLTLEVLNQYIGKYFYHIQFRFEILEHIAFFEHFVQIKYDLGFRQGLRKTSQYKLFEQYKYLLLVEQIYSDVMYLDDKKHKGILFSRMSQYSEARQNLERLLEEGHCEENDVQILDEYGILEYMSGDPKLAVAILSRALGIKECDSLPKTQYSFLYTKESKLYTKAHLVMAYCFLNHLSEAEHFIHELIQETYSHPDWLLAVMYYYNSRNRPMRALQEFEKYAYSDYIFPRHIILFSVVARSYLLIGNYKKADEYCKKALDVIEEYDGTLNYMFGRECMQLYTEQAIIELTKLNDVEPKDTERRKKILREAFLYFRKTAKDKQYQFVCDDLKGVENNQGKVSSGKGSQSVKKEIEEFNSQFSSLKISEVIKRCLSLCYQFRKENHGESHPYTNISAACVKEFTEYCENGFCLKNMSSLEFKNAIKKYLKVNISDCEDVKEGGYIIKIFLSGPYLFLTQLYHSLVTYLQENLMSEYQGSSVKQVTVNDKKCVIVMVRNKGDANSIKRQINSLDMKRHSGSIGYSRSKNINHKRHIPAFYSESHHELEKRAYLKYAEFIERPKYVLDNRIVKFLNGDRFNKSIVVLNKEIQALMKHCDTKYESLLQELHCNLFNPRSYRELLITLYKYKIKLYPSASSSMWTNANLNKLRIIKKAYGYLKDLKKYFKEIVSSIRSDIIPALEKEKQSLLQSPLVAFGLRESLSTEIVESMVNDLQTYEKELKYEDNMGIHSPRQLLRSSSPHQRRKNKRKCKNKSKRDIGW